MLEVQGLTKLFRGLPGVKDVSFKTKPGELLGYLGPNGAGKSTMVKMLTGLLEPTCGKILYGGEDTAKDFPAFQRRCGYVPEELFLYPQLSGMEYLQLAGRLRGLPQSRIDERSFELLRLFGLESDRHSLLASYSKGMRQKVLLSAAVLHDPEILILDEPFSGLDVSASLVLRGLLRRLAAAGKVVMLSSHVVSVVEEVCSRVLILRKGEMAALDSVTRLREMLSSPSLEDVFTQLALDEDPEARASALLEVIRS
jgi:ABC-2 type transport system ATP-binding protein